MPRPDTADPTPALRAEGLTKTFFTTDPPAAVLNGVDLSVETGEFLAIMGASGSGKSTLLYTLSGMDRPTTGSVLLDGRGLTDLDDDEASRVRLTRLGFVFQQAHLLDKLSIRDNILLPALKALPTRRETSGAVRRGLREAAVARVDALMERFGIDHVGRHGITEASGGQLQRAALCRALAAGPGVLFADEPTGALNSRMTEEVMAAFGEVHRDGTTIVMVTHAPECAARADRVVYLRDGIMLDSLTLGTWIPERAVEREDEMLRWLREKGF